VRSKEDKKGLEGEGGSFELGFWIADLRLRKKNTRRERERPDTGCRENKAGDGEATEMKLIFDY
jgi:hypothetical protein